MHLALLLGTYALLSIVGSLSGGWVPLVVRLTHRRMQIAISFVSGVVLGIGLLHLVPHSFFLLRSIDATVLWVMAGFLFMFFLERFFHFHQHEPPEQAGLADAPAPHVHDAHDHHHHDHGHAAPASDFSWTGATVGLTLHGLIDGLAIAAAVQAESAHGLVAWAGLGTALAVLLHKPFDSLTIGTLMAAAGRSTATRQLANALYALVTPLGIALFYFVSTTRTDPTAGLGQVLAFAGGAFICIASSDLLPELQFHHHDRGKLSLALVAGIALAWATVFLESAGHDHANHDHGAAEDHEADHDHDAAGHEGHTH